MRDTAQIHIADTSTAIQFRWVGFDGDDTFNEFHIEVTSGTETRRFSFGPCAVHGLRKLSGFFRSDKQESVGLGFRHPDIRRCDILRTGYNYRLVVHFEGSGVFEERTLRAPFIHFEDEFLSEY